MEGFYKEYDCGCAITDDGLRGYDIIYCPKHKATPDMYEALMEFPHYVTASDMDANQILDRIREWRHKYWQPAIEKALAKAEGIKDV